MIPRDNRNLFKNRYGEWWYLREFDYLPESILDYSKNISASFIHSWKKDKVFDLFETKEEAIAASYKIRRERGLMPFPYETSLL